MSDDIVIRLRRDCMSLIADEAADEIERLRKERDEARRELCRDEALIRLERGRVPWDSEEVVRIATEVSVERGWDCYKGNIDAQGQ